ncbi:MAG: tRNA dihydrouridine(20/20a) synthase DusA [Methylobacter sp.]|nr:tRNA dihydrouridine(20/20a) synthase DusA [Methylobacter sp.]MDP2097742.1 tRNA dihydrouridine(20/20a) synthase DusA [Methylobacter sp.]MDP2430218.1 tRNA dihydrouridine(20/20a) synthase DusA [Methylobacter sp.]MDP3056153.1 tRNA dihydrouridine(20/20a) synthase DusA [Methylobacter sp.]MDP3364354.1 tRNA dihydrouridine(20/20a) synthase DusA [Methylobacter sp.]
MIEPDKDSNKAFYYKASRFSIAPMLDWTDRHCRYFHRLISQQALLYTEMVTTGALIHGGHHRFLQFDAAEHPLAFQLGGSNPHDLALCAKMVEDYGYDEVNLNVGCPSDRVQNGRFGACLMAEPELVADCVAAMKQAVSIPVTVKSRIGIDERDSYQELAHFVATVATAGCETFIIHARKAWLSGLSPKQNRDVPPLRYEVVYQIKQDFPQLNIILNGGINTLEQADEILQQVDGVMVGREAYHNPYLLADVDRRFFGATTEPRSRDKIMQLLIPYIQQQLDDGVRLHSVSRHILGLFHGEPGARGWRRHLSENAGKSGADIQVILEALPTGM